MDNQHGNIEELYECAYTFGLLLGDGTLTYHAKRSAYALQIEMLASDAECLDVAAEQIKSLFPDKLMGGCVVDREGRRRMLKLSVTGFEVWAFFAGPTDWKQKIPQEFFSAPRNVQLELIAGLMDSDGCVEHFKQNGYDKFKVVFSNNKLELVTGLAGLLRLNGVSVGQLKTQVNYNGKPTYRLSPSVHEFARNCYFRCERKQARLELFKKLRYASETVYTAPLRG